MMVYCPRHGRAGERKGKQRGFFMPRPDVLLGEPPRRYVSWFGVRQPVVVVDPRVPPAKGSLQVEMQDAATLARHLVQFPHPPKNPGAMLTRQLAWRTPRWGRGHYRHRARRGLAAVRTGQVKDLLAEGIVDPARAARGALEHGASGAMLLLTTGALVIHRKPEGSVEP